MERITQKLATSRTVRDNELVIGFKNYDLNLSKYKVYLLDHLSDVKKVILVGEDPALYPDLPRLIKFNNACGVQTTIHTTGKNLQLLEQLNFDELRNVDVKTILS